MPTILKRIFQPKWQSGNSETRLEAIDSLTWEHDEQRNALLKLAESDPDPAVRQKAIQKVADTHILLRLLEGTENFVQESVCGRLATLFEASQDPSGVQEGAAKLSNDGLRYQLLKHLTQTDQKLAVLKTIKEPRVLAEIATQGNASRLRQAAAEELHDYALLEDVLKASMNKDKGVYQVVRTKLNARRDSEKRQQQQRQQSDELCTAMEALAVSEATHLYQAKFEALHSQWHSVAAHADADLAERAERAIRACSERVRRLREEEARRMDEARQNQDLLQERVATCDMLEQTLESLRASNHPDRSALSPLDALIKTQENRWLEATRDIHVDKAEQKRYQQAMLQLRHYFVSLQKYSIHEGRLNELLNTSNRAESTSEAVNDAAKELRRHLDDIQWPEEFGAPLLLRQAQERIGHLRDLRKQHSEDLRKLRQTVDQTVGQLEKELEERSLKNSTRLYKELQKLVHRLPGNHEHDYDGKLKLLHGRVQELRDWQGFATRPKQEELCERMEHLAEQHLDPQLKAHRIKELQNEWRALGGSSDQSLWTRFKSASDKAYEPCQLFFTEHDLLKQANLDKREMLCEQLQNFLDHINWEHVDWKAMDKISRKAREEWHRFFPVDHKRNKPLQKHFHKLIEELESHLNEERARNSARKADIVRRAEALIGQPEMREAAQAAKLLQREWETVGLTEHREDRLLWKAFRAACDQIFSQLENQRASHQKDVQVRLGHAEQLCESLERLAQTPGADLAQTFERLQQEFNALGGLPREQHALQDRFQKAAGKVRKILQKERLDAELEHWRNLAQQAEEIARFEDAVIAGQAPEESPRIETSNEIPGIIWLKLEQRRERAHQAQASDYADNQRPGRILGIRAEIAAGVDSPEPERGLRMEYQMERLSEGLTGSLNNRRPIDELTDILAAWYGLGPVEPTLRGMIQARIDKVLAEIIPGRH